MTAIERALVVEGKKLLVKDEGATSEFAWAWGDLALRVAPLADTTGLSRPRRHSLNKEAVTLISELREEGKTYQEIADTLNARGIPTTRGKPWTMENVHLRLKKSAEPVPVLPLERLRQWATEIGWFDTGRSFSTLKGYRQIAGKFPPDIRNPKLSFTAHTHLRNRPDRAAAVKQVSNAIEAAALAGKKSRYENPGAYRASIKKVRSALLDRDYAREILVDPAVREAVVAVLAEFMVATIPQDTPQAEPIVKRLFRRDRVTA